MLVTMLCCVAVLTLARPAAAEKQIPATPAQSSISMLPHLEWLLDGSGNLSVDDLGKPQQQAAFRPLKLQDLPREAGTVWLRFTLAGRPSEVRPATMLLDMGDGVPDTPTLFVPKHNLLTGVTEWQTFAPSQRSVFLMPETRQEPVTAYIRMDGLPGLWFSPMLRTPHNAATALERLARPAVIVALGVIMLLCLLRGLTERGEWRIWTSLYTAAALVHAVWGVPATSKGHVDMMNMAAVLAPGVGLMILPHVGRHLLRTRQTSRAIDIQLFLLSLPGAALALLPLVPGYSWTTRFLDLWPAGTLLLVPTTLGAWLCGLPGARRFLLGCLLPPLGVAVGILGMGTAIPAPLLGTAPLWGLALGALIIAGTAAPAEHRAAEGQAAGAVPTAQDLVDEDPNLRIVSPEELAQGSEVAPSGAMPGGSHELALEESLRGPMDDLLRDGAALAQCALPPVTRQLVDNMVQSVHRMATTLAGGPSHSPASRVREDVVFDLQEVLRQAHDAVSAVADSKNIALSWFMPPHLGQRYRGGVQQLEHVLCLLLESAVRATSRGAVQLAVRRVPESVNPGHLLFSVTDTGSGVPPEDRSSVALARAWELAGAHRGFLGVECNPHGATISFTLHLEPAGADMSAEAEEAQGLEAVAYPGIIVVEDSPGERQLLAFFLEGLGAIVVEARSTEEAVELYMDRPAQLLIFDGDLPPAALHTAVQRVRTFESAEGTTPAMIMGLSSNDAQWEVLRQAGFTHALPKPITRSGLRSTVCQLLPQCAAQESLTPEMDMSQNLPTLPLLGVPEAEAPGLADMTLRMGDMGNMDAMDAKGSLGNLADVGAAAPILSPARTPTPDSLPEPLADDEDVIDTGMPLLDMDPQPASRPAPAPDYDARMQLLPEMGMNAPVAGGASSDKGPLDNLSMGGTPSDRAPLGSVLSDTVSLDSASTASVFSQTSGGLELSPAHETPEALRSAPVAGKSHADYLTSLLDGDDDLIRHDQSGPDARSGLDLLDDAPEAHMAQAVREGAEEAHRADLPAAATNASTTPVEASPVVTEPAPRSTPSVVGAKVDILARAKEKTLQSAQPAPSEPSVQTPASSEHSEPLHAFDDVPAGTALFVSDAAPVQAASQAEMHTEIQAVPPAAPQSEAQAAPTVSTSVEADATPRQNLVTPNTASVEWVGEPRPVGTPASPPLRMDAEDPTLKEDLVHGFGVPQSPEPAVEWVGEPRPVDTMRAPAFGTPAAPTASFAEAAPVQTEPAPATSASPVLRPIIGSGITRDAAVEWVGEPRPIERPVELPVETPVERPADTLPEPVETALSMEPAPSVEARVHSAEEADTASLPTSAVEVPVEPAAEPAVLASAAETADASLSPTSSVASSDSVPSPVTPEATKIQEEFVPLSMHPEASEEKPQRQSREEKAAERAHLTLLPQSTPLMDFIIAEPAPAPQPAVTQEPVSPMGSASLDMGTRETDDARETGATSPVTSPSAPSAAPKASSAVRINITPAKVAKPAETRDAAPSQEPAEKTSVRIIPEARAGGPVIVSTNAVVTLGAPAPAAESTATPVAEASAAPVMGSPVAPAPAQQDVHAAPSSVTPEASESPDLFDDEDAVMFTPNTLGTQEATDYADSSALAGSPMQPVRPAQAAAAQPASGLASGSYATSPAAQSAPSATAMMRANYGSVGEPMPITKPDSAAPSKELPLTRLLDYFDQAVQHARQSFEKKDAEGVHEGASYIARQADKVGLRTLARMARCVADAGKAKDMDAVKDLLPELESTVERNRIALGG